MKQFVQNEEAVSPVIGVILMVAITVILAAVIAAFVFGMTGNVQTTKVVSVSGQINSSGYVTFTINGGADLAAISSINMTNGSGSSYEIWNTTPSVGETEATTGPQSGKRVMLIAKFKDGAEQIIFDKQF